MEKNIETTNIYITSNDLDLLGIQTENGFKYQWMKKN